MKLTHPLLNMSCQQVHYTLYMCYTYLPQCQGVKVSTCCGVDWWCSGHRQLDSKEQVNEGGTYMYLHHRGSLLWLTWILIVCWALHTRSIEITQSADKCPWTETSCLAWFFFMLCDGSTNYQNSCTVPLSTFGRAPDIQCGWTPSLCKKKRVVYAYA